jgi:8-oxo-dGTP pyrophosphatase MutT (NUDIX family)
MDQLREILKRKEYRLPGEHAHNKMMPSARRKMSENHDLKSRAAVLIPIFEKNNDYHLILIKRPEYEGVHSNQVSFPGGKIEDIDTDLQSTALRETNEEIGIPVECIEIVNQLTSIFISVSKYEVTPFVGILREPPEYTINEKEVQYVIETSLSHLLEPSSVKTTTMHFDTELIDVPYFDIDGEIVWGATAMILSEFLALVRD